MIRTTVEAAFKRGGQETTKETPSNLTGRVLTCPDELSPCPILRYEYYRTVSAIACRAAASPLSSIAWGIFYRTRSDDWCQVRLRMVSKPGHKEGAGHASLRGMAGAWTVTNYFFAPGLGAGFAGCPLAAMYESPPPYFVQCNGSG